MCADTSECSHETTSSASSFAVYLLATHPDVQQRLRKEVRETLSRYRAEELTLQILDSMPYLNAVASEALRVWPTVVCILTNNIFANRIYQLTLLPSQ
jgi:cytochrome P450